MMTATAHKVFTMTTDAPSDELLIEFADALSQNNGDGGLDSLDLGDTLGYFISLLESGEYSGDIPDGDMMLVSPEGFTVTVSCDWEPFNWNRG